MNQLFEDLVHPADPSGTSAAWSPIVDAVVHSDGYEVFIELPGVAPDSLEIEVGIESLTVRGHRVFPPDVGDGVYRIEGHYGAFFRTIDLPSEPDPASLEQELEDGVLRLRLRRR